MAAVKTVSIRISGKVQGVWFRASAKNVAGEYDLFGFAQNMPDGTVYIEAKGDAQRIDDFIAWCHHGPELADVRQVEVGEGRSQELPYPFEIRRGG